MSAEEVLAKSVGPWTTTHDGPMNVANRLLAALKAAGYAVVELPEPLPKEAWEAAYCIEMWVDALDVDHEDGLSVAAFPDSVEVAYGRYDPDEARRIAGRILAAADVAEVS